MNVKTEIYCLKQELALNAKMLARQTDMAREAENNAAMLLGALETFVSACETAPPIDLIKHLDAACKQAKAAISAVEGRVVE